MLFRFLFRGRYLVTGLHATILLSDKVVFLTKQETIENVEKFRQPTGWGKGNSSWPVITTCFVRISAETPAIPNKVLCGFPQSHQTNSEPVSRFGHDRFLLNPFQFITYPILTLRNLATYRKGKVVPVLNKLSTTPWRRMGEWMHGSTFSWPQH
jgi:hypothetical protein